MRKIAAGLSLKELENAIQMAEKQIEKIRKNETDIVRRLTEEGKMRVIRNITLLKAIDTAELLTSVRTEHGRNRGKIIVDSPHGVYVEYGTGIVGQGKKKDAKQSGLKHPDPDKNIKYANYGWTYYDKDYGYIYTEGMASRPFFYNSYLELQNEVKKIAKEEMNKR